MFQNISIQIKWKPKFCIHFRTKCSSLNNDFHLKYITDSPLCRCGLVENSHHYLLYCSFYTAQRNELFIAVSQHQTIFLNLLLFRDASLLYTTNVLIFEKNSPKVHKRHKTILTVETIWNKIFCTCNSPYSKAD